MTGPYDDLINLPHHVSSTRPQMPLSKRAAQFAPFAALTGYDEAIVETARYTDERIELDENEKDAIDMKLRVLSDMAAEHPEITVTHFQKGDKKDGGTYIIDVGPMKRIDTNKRVLILMEDKEILIDNIYSIECELFQDLL